VWQGEDHGAGRDSGGSDHGEPGADAHARARERSCDKGERRQGDAVD
jgi:hypothetical protein